MHRHFSNPLNAGDLPNQGGLAAALVGSCLQFVEFEGPMVGSVNLAVMVKSVNVGESGDCGELRERAARALIF
jgi:hypothetical protein